MNRRGFLGSILALGAAPAIVRADSLMKLALLRPPLLGVRALDNATHGILVSDPNGDYYLEWGNVRGSGSVSVRSPSDWAADEGVESFDVRIWTPERGWGEPATQSLLRI